MKNSFRTRLLVFVLILTILPIFFTGLISFRISSELIYNTSIDSSREMIERISIELNNLFSDTIYFMDIVQNMKPIQQGLKLSNVNISKPFLAEFNANTELSFITEYIDEMFGIYVIGENNKKYKSHYNFFVDESLRNTEWYHEIIDSDELKVFGPYRDSLAINTVYNWKNEFFALGTPFLDPITREKEGIILAEIEKKCITDIANSTLGKTGHILILDGLNNVIFAPIEYTESVDFSILPNQSPEKFIQLITNQCFLDKEEVGDTILIKNKNHIILYNELNIPNWKIVGVIPLRELRTDKDNRIWFIILVPILACIAATFAAWKISASIVKPVYHLSNLMKKVEDGNLNVHIDNPGPDEIGQLGKSFNVMVYKLQKSMNQIYEDQGKIRNVELQLLQAQINPHFLYNTLDTIKYLAKKNENQKVAKMAVNLARFFRSSLSNGLSVISLKEEVDRIQYYLIILKLRYIERFDYEISIPLYLTKQRILKLLLQPIVENAVYHGIKEREGFGIIRIKASISGTDCFIIVEDTGVGLSNIQLEELKKTLKNRSKPKGKSFGLWNIQERIKIFYGPNYGLSFESEYGKGTKVIIKIPKSNEEYYVD